MKKILLPLASLALVFPAYALDGEGTAANPFKIIKAEDFAQIETAPAGSYFALENDIDFAGANYVAPFQKTDEPGNINLDGKYHVIKNLVCKSANAGLFGMIDGTIKNLGIESSTFDCLAASNNWGPSGVFAAYFGITAPAVIENCYSVECTVAGSYAGGIVGGTKAGATIKNCYSMTDCTTPNAFAGGIIAAINFAADKEVVANISNCYATGKISGPTSCGIVGGNQNYTHPATGSEKAVLTDVVAWNESVGTAPYGWTGATPAMVLETKNVFCWAGMLVNGAAVEDGKTEAELKQLILTWPAFAAGDDGMPVLKWEVGASSGIADVAVDEAEAAPVYYNLQGVEVANPENGIYIVRRGNKVTKEVIR